MSDRQLIADLLSALEYHTEQTRPIEFSKVAIEAAREYLRKPEQPVQQEPVAWVWLKDGTPVNVFLNRGDAEDPYWLDKGYSTAPLYTRPQPPRAEGTLAQPLTRDQVKALTKETGYDTASTQERADFINGIRHAEAVHGITKDQE